MRLLPWEEERLLIFSAAELARRHRAAGLKLNHPEAVALIFKGGAQAWGPLGEGNASLGRAEPTRYMADWSGHGMVPGDVSLTFVSAAGLEGGIAARLGTRRRVVAVHGCRGLTRSSLWANRTTAPVDVDPVDGTVTLGGRRLAVEPAADLPLSRRYLLR